MGLITKTLLSAPNHSRGQELSSIPKVWNQGSIPCISLCSVSQARLCMHDIITKPRGQKETSPNHAACME